MRSMRTFLAFALALGAAPAAARVITASPRVVAPAAMPPIGALPRMTPAYPTLRPTPSLRLSAPSLSPSLPPIPALAPTPPSAAPSPAPHEALAAKAALEGAAAALSAPKADQAAASAKVFDAMRLPAPSDAPFAAPQGPSLRAPDRYEDAKIEEAVRLLSRTPVGRDVYAKAYNDHGSRLRVLVDENVGARYDARLYWRDGVPVLALTRDLLARGSDAAVAAFLVREFSHLYYREFTDSAERSWMAASVMARSFAEITGSGPRRWDYASDLPRDGRHVIRSYYESWSDALGRHHDPRSGEFFRWLKTGSDSKSGPNASSSLRELHQSGQLGWDAYRSMDGYFRTLLDSERRWLQGRH